MLNSGFRLPVLLLLAMLLSSSLASSYVPTTSLVNNPLLRSKFNVPKTIVTLNGGSDESLPEESPPPPPPAESIAPIASNDSSDAVSTTPASKSLLGPKAPPPGLLRRLFPSFPWHSLPNFLTYVRCVAIPALVGLFFMPNSHIWTGTLFAVASYTDWLDGYLARRWDITSAFGAFLDPVADKLMVSTSLILLAGRHGMEVSIPAVIILAREISVSALREWMAQRGQRDVVKVGFQGKVKTALTMVALTVLLYVPTAATTGFLSKLYMPGLAMLYLCTLVTVTSGSVYFIAAAPLLFEK